MKKLLAAVFFILFISIVFAFPDSHYKTLFFEAQEKFTGFACVLPDQFPETKQDCHIDLLCPEEKDSCKDLETEFLKIAQWAATQYSAKQAEHCEQVDLDYAEACKVVDQTACSNAWKNKSNWNELTEKEKEVCANINKEACDEIRSEFELCKPYLFWALPDGTGTCGVKCQIYYALNELQSCYQESFTKKIELCQQLYKFGYKQGGESSAKETVIKSFRKNDFSASGDYWRALSLCLANVEGIEESIQFWEDTIKKKQERINSDYEYKAEYQSWIDSNPNKTEEIAKRQKWIAEIEKDIQNLKTEISESQQKKENLEYNFLDKRVNEALAKMTAEEDKLHGIIQKALSNPDNQKIDGFKERIQFFWEKVSGIAKEINLVCASGKSQTIKEKMPVLEEKIKQLHEEELGDLVDITGKTKDCGSYCSQTVTETIGEFYDRIFEFRDYSVLMDFINGQKDIAGPTKAECEAECTSKIPFSFGKLEGQECTCPCRQGYVSSEGKCFQKLDAVPKKDDLKKNRFSREKISLENPPEPPPLNEKTKKQIKKILGLNADEFKQGMGQGKKAGIFISAGIGDYERLWIGSKINLMYAFMKYLGYEVSIYDRHSDEVILNAMFGPEVDAVASFSHGAEPGLQGLPIDGSVLETTGADYRRKHYEKSGMATKEARKKANSENSLGWSFCYNHSCHGGDAGYKELADFALREGGVYFGEKGILWATSYPDLSYTKSFAGGGSS